ncbi:unnamed protein product [Closterium sp. NIES-53]
MADTQRHLERWLAAHSYNHTCLQSFNCSSLRSHVLPLLLVIVFLSSLSPSLEAEAAGPVRQVVKLGFLLPYPKADHVIPLRLADEWIAASRVALEVLGPKYSDAFDVVPHIANSNCDRQEAKEAAQEAKEAAQVRQEEGGQGLMPCLESPFSVLERLSYGAAHCQLQLRLTGGQGGCASEKGGGSAGP